MVSFSDERWEKQDTGNGFSISVCSTPKSTRGEGVTHPWRLVGKQLRVRSDLHWAFWWSSHEDITLIWNLAPHNTSFFPLEGKDFALGQDMLALCNANAYINTTIWTLLSTGLSSHLHCTVQPLVFTFDLVSFFSELPLPLPERSFFVFIYLF